MKKVIIFFVVLLVLFLDFVTATVTGEVITGRASEQSVNASIQLIRAPPALTLITPQNKTYLINQSLLLNFSVGGEESIWYNLDNGSNITITSPTYFNTLQGSHTLYLFANNTIDGFVTAKNVSFVVNSSLLTIIYDEFNEGATTNFSRIPLEDLQNISNIIIEKVNFGKIIILEAVNLTAIISLNNTAIDLNSHINISLARIELDSSALPILNKSAIIILYNPTFSNPTILRDGVVCSSTICIQNSYSSGILSFNVTHFTVYSVAETSTETPTSSGSGGGGGGGGITTIFKKKEIIKVEPETISVKLNQGETKKVEIVVTNLDTKKAEVNLEVLRLERITRIRESALSLEAGESKFVSIDFLAAEDFLPGVYIGKIIAKTNDLQKEVLVSIDISSKKALFDVQVEIPEKYRIMNAGESVFANVILTNMGETKKRDTEIEYFLEDEEGNRILSNKETLAVETKMSVPINILIPPNTKPGKYFIQVVNKYDGETASASAWFTVSEKSLFEDERVARVAFVLSIAVLIIGLIIYLGRVLRAAIIYCKTKE